MLSNNPVAFRIYKSLLVLHYILVRRTYSRLLPIRTLIISNCLIFLTQQNKINRSTLPSKKTMTTMITPATAALSKKIARSDQDISSRPHKRRHSGPCLQQTPRPQEDNDFSCVFSLPSVNKRVRLAPKTPAPPCHQQAALSAVPLPLVSKMPGLFLPTLDDLDSSSQQDNDFFLFDTATRLKPRRRLAAAAAAPKKKTPLSSFPSFPTLDFLKDDSAVVKDGAGLEKEWSAAPTAPAGVPPVTLVSTLKHSRSSIALCA